MATLSLPVGIRTYLMTRALGALSKACSRLAAGVCSAVDCNIKTGVVIIYKTLSLTFLAIDTMVFWAAVGILCTESSSYSIACPVPLHVSPLVSIVIANVS